MKLVGNSRAIRSPEFHKKKERERWSRAIAWGILVITLFVAPIFILRDERLIISSVELIGSEVTSREEVESVVLEILSGRVLFFIPRASALLLDRSELEAELLKRFPRLSFVDASLSNMQTLEIEVAERKPFALYCEDFSDYVSPEDCYFIDEHSLIFSEAPEFSSGVYMIYATEPQIVDPLGKNIFDESLFNNLDKFVKDITTLGFSPKVLLAKGDEFALSLASGTEMRWKLRQNMQNLFSDFEVFLRDSSLKKAAFGDLLYIDLRIDNKVFYKFRD